MDSSWTLTSNDGLTSFAGKICKRYTLADGRPAYLAKIRLSSDFWRHDDLGGDGGRAEVVPDFELSLPQLILIEMTLRELLQHLDNWLDYFDAGRSEPARFEAKLSALSDQELSICIGVNKDLIVAPSHVGCVIRCGSTRLRGTEAKFVTDQSCLRLFRDDLQKFLLAC